MEQALAVVAELAGSHQGGQDGEGADDAGRERAEPGAEKSQFRHAPVAVDEGIVAGHVEAVGSQDNPHGHGRVVDGVAPLGGHVEHRHGQHADEVEDEIGADERQQLGGLAEAVEVEVDCRHYGRHEQGIGYVEPHGHAGEGADLPAVALAEKGSGEGSEAVGETDAAEDGHVEKIVDERGRCQGGGGVVADHDVVGKADDNHAELSHEDGQPEPDKFAVGRQECPQTVQHGR